MNNRPVMYGASIHGAGSISGPGQTDLPYPFPLGIQPLLGDEVSAGNDFIGAAIGPDGTPWASFNQDCGPSPKAPACRAQHGQTRGYAARLVHLPGG